MTTWEIKTLADYKRAEAEIQKRFAKMQEAMKTAPAQALYDALVPTLAKAVSRAPVEEGHLRQSGRIVVNGTEAVTGTADGDVTILATAISPTEAGEYDFEIGFWADAKDHGAGDVNTYAWVQHEHTEFSHPNGGQAKFLESAILEDQASWKKAVKDAVKEVLDE